MQSDELPEHLKGVITFGYVLGWRSSEITTLTWAQVDRKEWIVRLEPGDTKNKEARTVYLDNELKEVIKARWERRKKLGSVRQWVFLNRDGSDRVKRFYKAWKSACKSAGVGVRLFHDLRMTAVRDMVRAGVPELVAMQISGHKTRSVFDRYNIVDDKDLQRAAERASAYRESQMVTKTVTVHHVDSRQTT